MRLLVAIFVYFDTILRIKKNIKKLLRMLSTSKKNFYLINLIG